MVAETAAASVLPTYDSANSAKRVDVALLFAALFLQRFTLPFGNTLSAPGSCGYRFYFIVSIYFWKIGDPI